MFPPCLLNTPPGQPALHYMATIVGGEDNTGTRPREIVVQGVIVTENRTEFHTHVPSKSLRTYLSSTDGIFPSSFSFLGHFLEASFLVPKSGMTQAMCSTLLTLNTHHSPPLPSTTTTTNTAPPHLRRRCLRLAVLHTPGLPLTTSCPRLGTSTDTTPPCRAAPP
ncbi:hypothetical protein E2C01_058725 [Portunus trituberculatus]|uniref:Uncharacterized protein n=1 Tax=Portunus trituberculatus TaxID=210409 RepID=A0A5B7H3Z4_PORTR|nr:hypothetical protein [Portunus trituberculatus]